MISISELKDKNQWWTEPNFTVKESPWPKRELFQVIADNLEHTLMLNIVGLRRVGKSTLLLQIIDKLLQDKVNPMNIFYYFFDYSSQIKTTAALDEILAVYFKDILQQKYINLSERVYIVLDEIQYIEDWQSVLKRYYDMSGKMIKFIVTGSQSVLLKGKYRESLAGRIFDYYLPPLSFREFLLINRETIKQPTIFDLFNLPDFYRDLSFYQSENAKDLIRLSREYLTTGQFPENRRLTTPANRQNYIMESVIGKVLDDCIHIFKIEKTEEFKELTYQLLSNVSSIFEMTNVGREIALNRSTLDNYVEYLKESYVVEMLYKYHKSIIKGARLPKKLYTPCVNFICAINHYEERHVDEVPEVFGKIVENVIYNALTRKYNYKALISNISFYRQGEKEIDFIVTKNNEQLPIEVKFSNHVTWQDTRVLVAYLREHKLEYGIVVTRDELDRKEIDGQTVYYLPYYLVLFLI